MTDRGRAATRTRDALVMALTIATGSLDAMSYLSLGGVFVSVITGNLVLLGVGFGKPEYGVALRVGVSIGAYAVGVALGAAVAGATEEQQHAWPRRATGGLVVELVLLLAFTIGWEVTAGSRRASEDVVLVALAAAAMGIQGVVVNRLAVPGYSSTYLTSTLIRAVTELVRGPRDHVVVKVLALAGVVAGALGGALLDIEVPRMAPAIAVVLVGGVVSASALLGRHGRLLTVPASDD
jgi:uncharacterized membrane protein YoaK (UPF0700 family)